MEVIEHLSLHQSPRKHGVIDALVLHDTGGKSALSTLEWFRNPESKVSAHYLISKDGAVYQCVPNNMKAWHAGSSSLHGVEDVNEFSIGVELVDDNDSDPYPDKQLDSLFSLCTRLCREYRIPLNRVVGHEHIARGRKVDPGKDFPWFEFLVTLGARLTYDDE